MRKLSRYVALTAVAGALALAGCGGGDDGPSAEEAQDRYADITTQLNAFAKDLGTTVAGASAKSDAQISSEFDSLADQADAKIAELDDFEVPEDVTKAKDDLVDALKDGQDDLEAIASAAKANDGDAARAAATELIADSKDIEKAMTDLKNALKKAAG